MESFLAISESYAYTNELSKKDLTISGRAKVEFIENDSLVLQEIWKEYMGYTKDESEIFFKKLRVDFDEYYYKLMYNAKFIEDGVVILKDCWKIGMIKGKFLT